jgi:hypothetical protein
MDYVTQYYKNLSEKLNSRVNYLQRMLREEFTPAVNPNLDQYAQTDFAQQAKAASNLGDFSMQKGKPASRQLSQGYAGLDIDSILEGMPPVSYALASAYWQRALALINWFNGPAGAPYDLTTWWGTDLGVLEWGQMVTGQGNMFSLIGYILTAIANPQFRAELGINNWGDIPGLLQQNGVPDADNFWRITSHAMFQEPNFEAGERPMDYWDDIPGPTPGYYDVGIWFMGGGSNTPIGNFVMGLFRQNPYYLVTNNPNWYDPVDYPDGPPF